MTSLDYQSDHSSKNRQRQASDHTGKGVSRPAAWNTKTPLSLVDNEPLQHPLPSYDRHLPGTGPPQKQFSLHTHTQTSQDLSRTATSTLSTNPRNTSAHTGALCACRESPAGRLWLVGCGWHHTIQVRRITEEEPLRHTCMHLCATFGHNYNEIHNTDASNSQTHGYITLALHTGHSDSKYKIIYI